MPTSSQCLILQQKLNDIQASGRKSRCVFKEQAKCAVASVYNLSDCLPLRVSSVADHDAIQILGRESAQLFKYHSLPRGYQSILSPDKLNGVLQWQVVGGTEEVNIVSPSVSEFAIGRSADELEAEIKIRPKSAMPRSTSKSYVNPHILEYLLKLGFSRSALEKREDCVFDSVSSRRAFSEKALLAKCRTQSKSGAMSASNPTYTFAEQDKDQDESGPRQDNQDKVSEGSNGATDGIEDDFYRIKPSMYMRSDVPEPRPRAAIFSFRDNEYSSHTEVKYLIETQIKVKVKSIQFDPLDVRTVKPGVHSRWIVDFFSDWDLHQALKIGLTVGKDKLIFYKHDDITKREVSSFKYFMSIQEAKKKLKSKIKSSHSLRGAKSQK